MLAVVNQGYINSHVPLRVELHCIEAANLQDIPTFVENVS